MKAQGTPFPLSYSPGPRSVMDSIKGGRILVHTDVAGKPTLPPSPLPSTPPALHFLAYSFTPPLTHQALWTVSSAAFAPLLFLLQQ